MPQGRNKIQKKKIAMGAGKYMGKSEQVLTV